MLRAGEKALGDAVFERMEGDDGEPALRLEEMLGGAQAPRKLEKLLIEIEAERLEGPRRRVFGIVMLAAKHAERRCRRARQCA